MRKTFHALQKINFHFSVMGHNYNMKINKKDRKNFLSPCKRESSIPLQLTLG